MNWTTLVSAEMLAPRLGDPGLRLVDARFVLAGGDPGAGEAQWRAGHLPGAGYVHLDRELSDLRKPASEGRHPLPDAITFRAALERLGIDSGSQVVVYDAADGAMAAARFWWLLKLWGHENVAVLDGGFARWTALGLPVDAKPPTAAPSNYPGDFDASQIAHTEEVERRLRQGEALLLDARAPERFRGDVEPLDRVAGHVPNSRNRPYADNLADARFRSPDALRAQFLALTDGRAPGEILLSCGSGETACHNLLAMEHAGLHGARVYAESWSGWISDPSRPVATGPA
jgi:thiosulfate/3-mercaptopyruvate sulfurtransferase